MEAIRDMSWMRQLALSSVERFELRGFGISIVSVPPTSAHHGDRFRYRLLAIDPGIGKPILSVDLESDILGDYCLSLQLGAEHKILARFDTPPSLGDFRLRAIAEAEAVLPARPEGAARSEPGRGRKAKPR
jgi:hypothetical protein